MEERQLDTETLLALMAKLQFLAQKANEARIQGLDPRYDAIQIKAKDLINRLKKLIPAVMLNEIAYYNKVAKDLYQMIGEQEDFAIKGEKDAGH